MREKVKKMVEQYQCPGCVCGKGLSCYVEGEGIGCSKHIAGTILSGIGRVYLGMPKGFNRLGLCDKTTLLIFENFEDGWGYGTYNVPAWKHLDKHGNTLVRGICPRINWPFIHIFVGDVRSKIDCMEITQQELDEMD